jgi:hypothetical protein
MSDVVLAKQATGLACPDASSTTGVDHDTTNPTHYNSSFAQVNGKHAERLLANTIHLSPRRNRETRRGLQSPVCEKHTQMRSTVCGSELHLNEHKTQAGHLDNRHE